MRSTLFIFIFLSFSCFSQDSTLIELDSIKVHSPKRALILSAIVPGAGQIYNHNAMLKVKRNGRANVYWKLPIIYAGLGTTVYFAAYNNGIKNELKTEYTTRQSGGLGSDKWSAYDDQGILTLHDQYLKWRDLSILGAVMVYLFQMADAGVEAHFINFDVSEDLSMSFAPTMMDYKTAGLSIKLNFR